MTLPLVISIPHCGGEVPPSIQEDLALSPAQVADSMDTGTREIFGELPVLAVVSAHWSRLVVDLNRAPDDLGERGVITRIDYLGRPVFKPGRHPDRPETLRRVQAFHRPYHQELAQALELPGLRLLLDCHSLDGRGPTEAPDRGQPRADVTLGNNGGPQGEPDPQRGEPTCPAGLMQEMAAALKAEGFSVSLNHPYAGGYITRHYGALLRSRGQAALQMELNKDLFLSPQGRPQPERLVEVRGALLAALERTLPSA